MTASRRLRISLSISAFGGMSTAGTSKEAVNLDDSRFNESRT